MDQYETKELHLQDYDRVRACLKLRRTDTVENVVNCLYMWKNLNRTKSLQFEDGMLFLMEYPGGVGVQFPACRPERLEHYFGQAADYFHEVLGRKLFMFLCDEEAVRLMKPDPEKYEVIRDRDHFDYVYDAQKLRSYSGRPYHQKKNHVNAFCREYEGRFEYRTLQYGQMDAEIMSFLQEWECGRDIPEEYDLVPYELAGIEYMLKNGAHMDYRMGGVLIDGRLQAFTLGTYVEEEKTVYVHTEKANPQIRGLYPLIAQMFLRETCPEADYANREDDMGLEGLRRSKLSYHPVRLVEKYGIRER